MNKKRDFRGRCGRQVPLLAALLVLAGCQTGQQVDPGATAGAHAFYEQLSMTTQAINIGDLETARHHLGDARSVAMSARDLQKIESLDQLIIGAEALRSGDPSGARAAWSRIEEPRLAREVRHKARLIGVEVPMVPMEEGTTQ